MILREINFANVLNGCECFFEKKKFQVFKTNLKKREILSSVSSISREPLMVLRTDVRMTLLPNLVFAGISQICRNKMLESVLIIWRGC